MMSGTDLSRDGFLDPYWEPRKYALELADLLGCREEDSFRLMQCMRENNTNTWQRILSMQELITPRVGINVGIGARSFNIRQSFHRTAYIDT